MKNYIKILDIVITISLTSAIIGSFFIVKKLQSGPILLPQPFYFFLIIALVASGIKIRFSTESRKILIIIAKKYCLPVSLFFFFILLNLLFFIPDYLTNQIFPFFLADLIRVVIEMILGIMIILHLTTYPKANFWLTTAFFVPLTLTPLLFFRDIDMISKILPKQFFTNYSLQALQYNTTSLATWLIITFAFSVSYLFLTINNKKTFLARFVSTLCTIIIISLIWWTSSRGALLTSIFIYAITGCIVYWKQKVKLAIAILFLPLIFFISLYILPTQAKSSVLVRYYPQYRTEIKNNNYKFTSISDLVTKTTNKTDSVLTSKSGSSPSLPTPNFINSQDRQNLWPKHILYILNHPLGIYGPEIISNFTSIGLEQGEHNTLLQAGKWGGWGSLIILGLFIIYIFKISADLIKKYSNTPKILGLVMAFTGIFALSMLNSFIHLKTFWILLAMIIAYSLQSKTESINIELTKK